MKAEPSFGTPPALLVADDQRDIVDSVAALLEGAQYRVFRAYSASEALASLDDHAEISLLISDIRMPETDGFDLMRVVRHRFNTLPVILMTGLPITEDDVVPARATILTKPFTFEELERAVRDHLVRDA